jgi:excisionase family DNA binding protein
VEQLEKETESVCGERLLTPAEVAQRLGVKRSYCYAILGARDGLPVVRLGKKLVRVMESDLSAYMRRHRHETD